MEYAALKPSVLSQRQLALGKKIKINSNKLKLEFQDNYIQNISKIYYNGTRWLD